MQVSRGVVTHLEASGLSGEGFTHVMKRGCLAQYFASAGWKTRKGSQIGKLMPLRPLLRPSICALVRLVLHNAQAHRSFGYRPNGSAIGRSSSKRHMISHLVHRLNVLGSRLSLPLRFELLFLRQTAETSSSTSWISRRSSFGRRSRPERSCGDMDFVEL